MRWLAALALAATLATLAAPASSATATTDLALQRSLAYLALHSTGAASEYMVEAVTSAGLDPGLWPTPQLNLLDRLAVPAVGTPGNDPIREIHAVAQSGYDPRHFQGRDLVADLEAAWARSNQGTGQAAFTLLALHAAGVPATDATYQATLSLLQTGQGADGGWSCIGLSSPDCTGYALTALRAADGFTAGMAQRAKLWLDGARQPNGGYGSAGFVGGDPLDVVGVAAPAPALAPTPALAASGSNTQSTIWAVHGYRALGQAVPDPTWAYLRSRQMPDGGFAWQDGDTVSNLWATEEVVAGWARSFHDLPIYADASIVAPDRLEAGAPATFALSDRSLDAKWSILAPAAALETDGNPVDLTFALPGTAVVHVEGDAPGVHHREKTTVQVGNPGPHFLDLPSTIAAGRVTPLRLDVQAQDAAGNPADVRWSFQGSTGQGAVDVRPTQLGTFLLRLTATDQEGLTAETAIPVLVGNLDPVLDAVDIPDHATAGAPVAFAAAAHDPDGTALSITWSFGTLTAQGPTGSIALPAGCIVVQVTASDADGGRATVERVLDVQAAALSPILPALPHAERGSDAPAPSPQPAPTPVQPSQAQPPAANAHDAPSLEAGLLVLAVGLLALRRRA